MRDARGMVLAFDFGTVRIGVAVGAMEAATARGLEVVANRAGRIDWKAVDRLVQEWSPAILVIGEPQEQVDQDSAWYQAMRRFCTELEARYRLPIARVNEDYSSAAARSQLREQRHGAKRKKARKGETDMMAAAYILSTWFSERDAVLRED